MFTIKKVVITAFGDESKLLIAEAELPDPLPGEVQVEVDYSVVSGSDVNMRRGVYPFQKKAPLTPGYSVVGTVRLLGKGCTKFRTGDRIACLSKYEGQAERINLPEKFLVPVPAGVDLKEAVALVLDWVTAYEMLHRAAHIARGQKIFVHGLTGGVGTALVRLAQMEGAEVSGTASASKHEGLRAEGVVPYDYRSKDWVRDVQGNGGVDAVFDPLGYKSFDESYSILKRGGTLVAYGMNLPSLTKTPRTPALPVILKLLSKNLLFWSGKRTTFFGLNRTSKNYGPDLQRLFAWLKAGTISVPIKATFNLEEIQAAHREYASGAGVGSIILEIAGR